MRNIVSAADSAEVQLWENRIMLCLE